MLWKYQVLLQQAFNYIIYWRVNINQNETASWNMEKRKQMKWFRIKTLDPDISALVYQRDQSWFLTDLFLIFEQRTGVEFGLLVLILFILTEVG